MKSLRSQIVLAVGGSALLVFALSFLLINVIVQGTTTSRLDSATELIVKNGGEFPGRVQYDELVGSDFPFAFTEEAPYRLRYFSVLFEDDGSFNVIDSHIAAIDAQHAPEMALWALEKGKETGYNGDYRYRVSQDGRCVVFLDCAYELENVGSFMKTVALVELLFVILIILVFSILSKYVVKPFEDNAAAQRQFVTDASHELKTPVAIISANAEVLAYKNKDSEWVRSIIEQVERINVLVNEMLTLSRLEEAGGSSNKTSVDVSSLVTTRIDEFNEVFASKAISVETDIADNININADASQLDQLMSVLLENASKYTDESGKVKILLKRSARTVTLSIFNSCEVSPDVDYTHLFDRFYRPDSSRTTSTGGHGIGLSIAKRICELHGGTISAKPSEEGMTFTAVLSAKLSANPRQNESSR